MNHLESKIHNQPFNKNFLFYYRYVEDILVCFNSTDGKLKSNHPYSHKLAALHSFVHRLINIPIIKDNFIKELNLIKQMALYNGYSPNLVDNILKSKLNKQFMNQVFPTIADKLVFKGSMTYSSPSTNKMYSF